MTFEAARTAMYSCFTWAAVMFAFSAVLFVKLEIREALRTVRRWRGRPLAGRGSRYRIVRRVIVTHDGEEAGDGGGGTARLGGEEVRG